MIEVVFNSSRYSYSDTIERLTKAIADAASTLFANLDQSVAAKTVGLSLRPTTLIISGNPKGGTPLMDTCPLIAIDLPLKLLVWEENGLVKVAYIPMRIVAERFGVTGKDNLLAALDRTLEALVAVVTYP